MVDVKKGKELLRKIIREEYDKPGAAVRAERLSNKGLGPAEIVEEYRDELLAQHALY
ncbi:hypothetical protein RYB01_19385 [Pseudomonas syringae]|nr:hypothetical protein [Pseudomonas syringae]